MQHQQLFSITRLCQLHTALIASQSEQEYKAHSNHDKPKIIMGVENSCSYADCKNQNTKVHDDNITILVP